MCHKYHVKHTSKQCNLDRLKSGSKRDTNETPTCAYARVCVLLCLIDRGALLLIGSKFLEMGSFKLRGPEKHTFMTKYSSPPRYLKNKSEI